MNNEPSSRPWDVVRLRVYLATIIAVTLSLYLYVLTADEESLFAQVTYAVTLGMIPACIVGLLWEIFLKHGFADYVLNQVWLRERFDTYGVRGFCSGREEIDMVALIRKARKRVWIQVTSLSYLTETAGVQRELIAKAKKGKDVRILGLDGESESARLRSAFHPIYKNLREEIPLFLSKFKEEVRVSSAKVRTRLYDKVPTCALFIIDDILVVCPLLSNKRGRESVHFRVTRNTERGESSLLFREYEEHFSLLFCEARDVAGS